MTESHTGRHAWIPTSVTMPNDWLCRRTGFREEPVPNDCLQWEFPYLLHFCSTNRGTSTSFPVQPVSLPQRVRTPICLPTGHGPKAGSCSSVCYPALVSHSCSPWGIPLTWSRTEWIGEIWTDPCTHFAFIVRPSQCSSELGRDKTTQLIVWLHSIALFSSFNCCIHAERIITRGKFLLAESCINTTFEN